MRTRARLLLSFLSAHIALTIIVGVLAYHLLHNYLRDQAADSARSLANVLAAGGFTLSDRIQSRMAELTGFDFSILRSESELSSTPPAGTIQVPYEHGIIRVHYQTGSYHKALQAVFAASVFLGLGGSLLFALIAWRLAGHVARPLERLALSARAIGSGEWQRPVPEVGKGEILRLATDLDIMRRQLLDLDQRNRYAERLATLGTFTATIAHEVRNPLSAIRLSVQMLRQQYPDDPGLAMIENEIERLDETVDELLGFSKGMQVNLEPCQIKPIIDDVMRLLQRQVRHAGVEVAVGGGTSTGVWADPRRLRQLLLNVVLNALQALHSRDDGRITITIDSDGFAVCDNGPGVAEAVRPHLFQAFQSNRQDGTGLGLHLAQLIAQAHQAELAYRPDETGGSCFVLSGLQPATIS